MLARESGPDGFMGCDIMKVRPEDRFEGEPPLKARRIAITRPEPQGRHLTEALQELGGDPLGCPTICIDDPADLAPLRESVDSLEGYAWVVFTSVNGVERFLGLLDEKGVGWPEGVQVAAIGPATAAALRARDVPMDLMPSEFVAEAVAQALIERGELRGRRVLLPRAAGARPVLRELLQEAGAEVDEIAAYESRPDSEGIERLQGALERNEIDMVTFTAASTLDHFVDAAGPDLGRARVAVIGPITAAAARARGVRVDTMATEYTVEGLVQAILEYYAGRPD